MLGLFHSGLFHSGLFRIAGAPTPAHRRRTPSLGHSLTALLLSKYVPVFFYENMKLFL